MLVLVLQILIAIAIATTLVVQASIQRTQNKLNAIIKQYHELSTLLTGSLLSNLAEFDARLRILEHQNERASVRAMISADSKRR